MHLWRKEVDTIRRSNYVIYWRIHDVYREDLFSLKGIYNWAKYELATTGFIQKDSS